MSEAELARVTLGGLLYQLRESAELTQEAVGKELWTSGTTVHRIEQGKSPIKGPQLETLLRLFDVNDEGLRQRLLRLAQR